MTEFSLLGGVGGWGGVGGVPIWEVGHDPGSEWDGDGGGGTAALWASGADVSFGWERFLLCPILLYFHLDACVLKIGGLW